MTPIERAARALAICDQPKIYDRGASGYSAESYAALYWPNYVGQARAVIEAIREPSEGMVAAAAATPGIREVDGLLKVANSMGQIISPAALTTGSPVEQAYQAMIDALLEEGK